MYTCLHTHRGVGEGGRVGRERHGEGLVRGVETDTERQRHCNNTIENREKTPNGQIKLPINFHEATTE